MSSYSDDQQVRLAIYNHLVAKGTAPTNTSLLDHLSISKEELYSSLYRLHSNHALVLDPDTKAVWMAHPFSAIPTPYPVKTGNLTYYANCAWDALGIPALLRVDSITETVCVDCQDSLTIGITGDNLIGSDYVIHFSVPPRHFYDDVGFT